MTCFSQFACARADARFFAGLSERSVDLDHDLTPLTPERHFLINQYRMRWRPNTMEKYSLALHFSELCIPDLSH
jgi:hypothetical protein